MAETKARVRVVTVTLHPMDMLSSNHRHHWRVRQQITRRVRQAGSAFARQQLGQPPQAGAMFNRPVAITAELAPPVTQGRRDTHNWMPTIKALVDGLVDARVIVDDNDKWLHSVTLVPGRATGVERWRITLTIKEVNGSWPVASP